MLTPAKGQQTIANVYGRCVDALPEGGVLVNGDFIKPDGTDWDHEPGRFEITRHLDFLREGGFVQPRSLQHFEYEIEQPTAAQTYICLVVTK